LRSIDQPDQINQINQSISSINGSLEIAHLKFGSLVALNGGIAAFKKG
jgi:hypothetical protein